VPFSADFSLRMPKIRILLLTVEKRISYLKPACQIFYKENESLASFGRLMPFSADFSPRMRKILHFSTSGRNANFIFETSDPDFL